MDVIIQATSDGVEAAAVDPAESMRAVDNPALVRLAADVRERLARVVAAL